MTLVMFSGGIKRDQWHEMSYLYSLRSQVLNDTPNGILVTASALRN